jgi:hypothetical protein
MKQQRGKIFMKWTLPDIVDLEYFLEQDQGAQGEENLKKRDRQFYLNRIRWELDESASHASVHLEDGSLARQAIFRWLGLRRDTEKKQKNKQDGLLPGSLYKETATLLTWLFLFGGIFLGITVVASFFSYSGTRPLNISYYLTLTLLGQLMLLGVSMAGFVFTRTGDVSSPMPLLQRLLGLCVHRTVETLKQKSLGHISRDHQDAMAAALGLIRAKHRIYGSLFFWPLFVLGQVFALGFNVGVLGMTLARVFFSDTAFGWQSTLQVGPELVHRMISVVALPWSWLFPQGVACPTLEQIAGSRMVLKDGIYHLTTGDLISWWPFLCLCVFFYGLLPRLALVGVGQWMRKRCLGTLTFNHASCQRLLARMTTPLVSIDGSLSPLSFQSAGGEGATLSSSDPAPVKNDSDILPGNLAGEMEKPSGFPDHGNSGENQGHDRVQTDATIFFNGEKKEANSIQEHGGKRPSSDPDPLLHSRRALVLVSDDLEEMLDGDELARQVLMNCGVTLVGQILVGVDSHRELEMIKSICTPPHAPTGKKSQTLTENTKKTIITEQPEANTQHPVPSTQYPASITGPISSIVWMHEAWQPPIKETLFFLQGLRRVTGDGMDIILGLVGKPSADTLFTPPSAIDLSVWQKKLDALGDPWLRLASMESES